MLDAQDVAGGATGRSAGMVVAGLPGHYGWAVQTFGRGQARELWQLGLEGRDALVDAAMRLGVYLEQPGSLALAVTEEEAESLRQSAEMLSEDGFAASFSPTDPLLRNFLGAVQQPRDAVVDATALTRTLLASAPVAVHINTEVHDLEPEGGMVRVWAQGRNVRCERVVLAVDGYGSLLDPSLAQWVVPSRALLAVTEPLPDAALDTPCYADYGYEYACPLPDKRLLLGAWRRPRSVGGQHEPDASIREGLARFIERYFPEVPGRIESRRSGVMGLTPDGLPIVGRFSDLPQVTFALGLGPWGLGWAFAVAKRLVDWMLDGDDLGLLAAERLT